jgi:hypothetical protein
MAEGQKMADDGPTCGQGLAQHAALPRLVGALLDSVADNLVAHLSGLVSSDQDSRQERRAYESLAARHREIAAMLGALGDEMAGCRDMPMGAHDLDALSSPAVTKALARMVRVEAELAALVEDQLAQHRAMLDELADG